MFLSSKASRSDKREAQRARDNRAEIVKSALDRARSRAADLYKWGLSRPLGSWRGRTA